MFEGFFDNSEATTIHSLIFRKPKNRAKTIIIIVNHLNDIILIVAKLFCIISCHISQYIFISSILHITSVQYRNETMY